MFTVMVSIGRNVGSQPLSSRDWTRFINDASDVIRNQGESPEFHYGTGMWDGIREESVHITVYRDVRPDDFAIRAGLKRLAIHYGQDAIALSISEPILVRP